MEGGEKEREKESENIINQSVTSISTYQVLFCHQILQGPF